MPLNKQTGNMFPFVDWTINPIAGKCQHKCSYCSTPIIGNFRQVVGDKYAGEYLLITKELYNWGNDRGTIFIENMGDLFESKVPHKYIIAVLEHCRKYPGNTYLFCTKRPSRYYNYIDLLPPKTILGTTIETDKYPEGVTSKAPTQEDRVLAMRVLKSTWPTIRRMVSIEPILKLDSSMIIHYIKLCKPEFVYIGYDSKKQNLPEPTDEEVMDLIKELKTFTKVLLKPNAQKRLGMES